MPMIVVWLNIKHFILEGLHGITIYICLLNKLKKRGVSTHPCGFLAVSTNAHKITLFHITRDTIMPLSGHSNNIPYIDISPDGRYLVSVSIDETSRVWDISTGACIRRFDIGSW